MSPHPYPLHTRVVHPERGPGTVASHAPSRKWTWVEFDREQPTDPDQVGVIVVVATADLVAEDSPERGHTWRVTVESRGSYAVVGQPHRDAAEFTGHGTITVRAWSLREALETAAGLPLAAWPAHAPDDAPTAPEEAPSAPESPPSPEPPAAGCDRPPGWAPQTVCPVCGAAGWEPCSTRAGRQLTRMHVARRRAEQAAGEPGV